MSNNGKLCELHHGFGERPGFKRKFDEKQAGFLWREPCGCRVYFRGFESEKENINAVKAQITLVRFALNVIAIYTDPTKFNAALEVATVVAGWTGGVGVPIVHTLIYDGMGNGWIFVWCIFIVKGESIPIFKTRNTWITDIDGFRK